MKNIAKLSVLLAVFAAGIHAPAQTLTDPNPNRVISWNLDDWSTVNPTDLAGLAPAVNWVDTYLNDVTTGLPDNTGTATSLNLSRGSYNTWHVQGSHPGLDANGTANRELLNGYLNAGPAAWLPNPTNTWVTLTNIPYARYDVIVYFNSDSSGRHGSIDNGTNARSTTYYFSTVGGASRSGANALFLPTTETNATVFPPADFAFFPGMTNISATFTENPKSGNDQWLGICALQLVESSNVYVLYGPTPETKTSSLGQPVSFSVMAGGLNPTYQWRHAGTNLLNATNATYAIASTVTGQDGAYDVVIANSFSSMTSAVATLTFYAPKTDVWAGTGGTWDFSSLNWTLDNGVSTTNYADTDHVQFGPLGAGQSGVSVSGTVTPGSITVSNASYSFASGSLGGTGSLRLRQNATLFLNLPDNRSGATLIDAGSTLELDANGTFGSGPLTNNGALLFNTTDASYGYPIYGTGSITNNGGSGTVGLDGDLHGNYLVNAGSGTLLLQGHHNAFTGGVVIAGGTVLARDDGSLGGADVLLSGGELQLVYNFNYVGSALTLAGGMLHGGVAGGQSFAGPVTMTVDSMIQVDGGGLTLSNITGLAGSGMSLTKIGNGPLILLGTNNTWSSVNLSAGTLQIGNGGTSGSLGAGYISVYGTLAFNLASNLTVTNDLVGPGTLQQDGSGTVTLTADLGTSGFAGAVNVNHGTLQVNVHSGYGIVTVNTNGTLSGPGIIGGDVNVSPAGTLAPGAIGGVGTLTLNGSLTLGGNLVVDVNTSLLQSNDLVVVNGSLNNTNSGVVSVNNLGPTLVAGQRFQLFSQPVTGGEMLTISNVSGNVLWTNTLATDGTIAVLSVGPAIASYPTNINYTASGGKLSLAWPATHLGWILQAQTNALGAGLGTNWVDVPGTAAVTVTNLPVNAANPTVFFRLRHP